VSCRACRGSGPALHTCSRYCSISGFLCSACAQSFHVINMASHGPVRTSELDMTVAFHSRENMKCMALCTSVAKSPSEARGNIPLTLRTHGIIILIIYGTCHDTARRRGVFWSLMVVALMSAPARIRTCAAYTLPYVAATCSAVWPVESRLLTRDASFSSNSLQLFSSSFSAA